MSIYIILSKQNDTKQMNESKQKVKSAFCFVSLIVSSVSVSILNFLFSNRLFLNLLGNKWNKALFVHNCYQLMNKNNWPFYSSKRKNNNKIIIILQKVYRDFFLTHIGFLGEIFAAPNCISPINTIWSDFSVRLAFLLSTYLLLVKKHLGSL